MSPVKFKLLRLLLVAFGLLPLPIVHGLGVFLGWLSSLLSLKHARLTEKNLQSSGIYQDGIEFKRAVQQNIGESGKALLETLAIWFRSDKRQLSLVKNFDGWQHHRQPWSVTAARFTTGYLAGELTVQRTTTIAGDVVTEKTTSLAPTNWQPIQTNAVPAAGSFTFPIPRGTDPKAFFRVKVQ